MQPKIEELRHVVSAVAIHAIEAAMADKAALRRFARDWFPDADEFDIRYAVDALSFGLNGMADLIEQRRARMAGNGRVVVPGGGRG